jgi:hypothetical protein
MNGDRRVVGDGEAVTAVNAEGGEIDAQAWRWEVEERGEARSLIIQVTGPAAAGNDVRSEVNLAIESHGRSIVDELIEADEPLPRVVTLLAGGRREVVF